MIELLVTCCDLQTCDQDSSVIPIGNKDQLGTFLYYKCKQMYEKHITPNYYGSYT